MVKKKYIKIIFATIIIVILSAITSLLLRNIHNSCPVFVSVRLNYISAEATRFSEGYCFVKVDDFMFNETKITVYKSKLDPQIWIIEKQEDCCYSMGFINLRRQELKIGSRFVILFKKPIIENEKLYISEPDLVKLLDLDKIFGKDFREFTVMKKGFNFLPFLWTEININ